MKISENIELIDGTIANCYSVNLEGKAVLVDVGMKGSGRKIIDFYRNIGVSPELILITHYHPDHVGGLFILSEEFHPQIYVPDSEAEVIAGHSKIIPAVTHSQRNRLSVTISNFRTYVPEPDRIIELIESVSGGPLASVQTDRESDMFVLRNHENPRFVEDVARDIARAICNGIDMLEDDAIIRIMSRSEESLHNHDAFADIELTAGETRKYS